VSNDEFGKQVAEGMRLPREVGEQHFRRLLHVALAEGYADGAIACFSALSLCLAAQGKLRENVRLLTRFVRSYPSARSVVALAYALERYGWLSLAERFFARAMEVPEDSAASVPHHEHARVGLLRTRAMRASRGR